MKKYILYLLFTILLSLPLVIPQTKAYAASENLIPNPSVETASKKLPVGWEQDSWGTNVVTFKYLNSGQSGSKSLQVNVSSLSSGDAKWFFDKIEAKPNTSYTYSEYYKSNVETSILVQYTYTDGSIKFQWLKTAPVSKSWKNISVDFTTPDNVAFLTVMHTIAQKGNLVTDNFSLISNGDTPVENKNIVPNPSLETVSSANSNLPESWVKEKAGTNTTKFTYQNTGHTGTKSLKIQTTSYTSGSANYHFDMTKVNPSEIYNFSVYYKSNTDVELDTAIGLTDGSTQYFYLATIPASTSWKEFSLDLTMPANASSTTVYLSLASVGYLMTDDYSMVSKGKPQGFNQGIVSLTFDDGLSSQYTTANQLLQQYSMNATFYIPTGSVGDTGNMTYSQIADLLSAGNEIGSHTITHAHLTTLSATDLDRELKDSQLDLENNLGVPITSFATPYGEYNDQVISGIKTYYTSHRSTNAGFNSKTSFDAYNIKVQNVNANTTVAEVKAWVDQAKSEKLWLVLVYHDIVANGDDFSTTPGHLSTELSYIQQTGISVQTMSDALAQVQGQI